MAGAGLGPPFAPLRGLQIHFSSFQEAIKGSFSLCYYEDEVLEVKKMENRQTNPLLWLGIALVLAVGLMALFMALFAPFGEGYGMMGGGIGWGWPVFMVIPAIFLILVLLAALGAFSDRPAYAVPTALETLNARYARGEISQEEYASIRADLERGAR